MAENSRPASQRALSLITLETVMSQPLPEPSWLVDRLISDGSRVVVYGEWASYKSWGLLHLALSIAAGQPWLGKFPIRHARSVLYIDEEMHDRTLRRRVKRLANGMNVSQENTQFRALSRHGVRLDREGTTALLADLRKTGFDPDVVIVETLRRVLVGDEKEAKDVAEFWRSVAPILLAGKTLIVSHHMRKGSSRSANQARDRASGSTDILGGADDSLAFERDKSAKGVFVVRHMKCRDGEEQEPFVVTLVDEGETARLRYEGTPTEFTVQARKTTQAKALIEAFLESSADGSAKTRDILAHLDGHGISERTGEAALKILREDVPPRITAVSRGVYRLAAPEPNRKPQPHYRDDGCGGSAAAASASESSVSAAVPQRIAVAEPPTGDLSAIFDTPCQPIDPDRDEAA